jgi:hypothetical protein
VPVPVSLVIVGIRGFAGVGGGNGFVRGLIPVVSVVSVLYARVAVFVGADVTLSSKTCFVVGLGVNIVCTVGFGATGFK